MKSPEKQANKELYSQLRRLPAEALCREMESFDSLTAAERNDRVALVRAVGVVFSESASEEQKKKTRPWLRGLLQDSNEKVRRYAITAIPKIGAGPEEETSLLRLMRSTQIDREREFVHQTLEKIGSLTTLEEIGSARSFLSVNTEQKVKASLAREKHPSSVRLDAVYSNYGGLHIQLHGRLGLEKIIAEEVNERVGRRFQVQSVQSGCVGIVPRSPFSIGDLYQLRCFSHVGFLIGETKHALGPASVEPLAAIMTSNLSRQILRAFTEGPIRYRLAIIAHGVQKSLIQQLANKAYSLCPEILNDPHSSPWSVDIRASRNGFSVELVPRLTDPRFFYRVQDIPAASYPPLAASMARLAGRTEGDVVWDPFCGSGLELIERALLGGVKNLFGTDINAEAISIASRNFEAAKLKNVISKFSRSDFRDFNQIEGLGPDSATLIITNPPMGKRVPVPNLSGLINDLFTISARVLRPGGRLVFCNPLFIESRDPRLKLQSRRTVDFGGFNCRLEVYRKF
jgi:tRNA G10  N-methylase Trm11